jgi:hypothetical protein
MGRLNDSLHVAGTLSSDTLVIPAGTLVNAGVSSIAAIGAEKLDHQHQRVYAQNGTAASATQVIHYTVGTTGTVYEFKAGSVTACTGAATITVDLRKNGTTMLTAVITLDNANTAYIAEAGTLSATAVVAGDVLTVVIVATAGGGTLGTGLFVHCKIREKAD